MNRRNLLRAAILAVPAIVAGGLVYADAQKAKPFTCPITGETLPCPKCCPLNDAAKPALTCPVTGEDLPCEKCCPLNSTPGATAAQAPAPRAKAEGFICPITGEPLGCPGCCPLNESKR
jgi:hypothetical protein